MRKILEVNYRLTLFFFAEFPRQAFRIRFYSIRSQHETK